MARKHDRVLRTYRGVRKDVHDAAAWYRIFRTIALFFAVSTAGAGVSATESDPFESLNRHTFAFNQGFDRRVLRPAAESYRRFLPGVVRTGVGNVLRNFRDVNNTLNSALQVRMRDAGTGLLRLGLNTTVGLGGVVDVATALGIETSYADFGQTLARWRLPSGPYLVVPIVGPSTVRDGVGFAVDALALSVPSRVDSIGVRAGIWGTAFTHARSQIIGIDDIDVSDPYLLYRDLYFQTRQAISPNSTVLSEGAYDDFGNADGFLDEIPGDSGDL